MNIFDTSNVDKLAFELDAFGYDFDYYDYMDATDGDRETSINELKASLYKGDISVIVSSLETILDEDLSVEDEKRLKDLIARTKRFEGACFKVRWEVYGKETFGFIKASSPEEAIDISRDMLDQKICTLIGISQAFEHQITRQNLCLNFHNPAPEPLFG